MEADKEGQREARGAKGNTGLHGRINTTFTTDRRSNDSNITATTWLNAGRGADAPTPTEVGRY